MKILALSLVIFLLVGCGETNNKLNDNIKQSQKESNSVEAFHTFSESESDYFQTITELNKTFEKSYKDVSKIVHSMKSDSDFVKYEGRYEGDMLAVSGVGNLLDEMSKEHQVPKRFKKLHHDFTIAVKDMSESGKLTVEGFDNSDLSLVSEGAQKMDECNSYITKSAHDLQKINDWLKGE